MRRSALRGPSGVGLVGLLVVSVVVAVLELRQRSVDGSRVPMGMFRGTDAAEVEELEQWLGRELPLAVDYSARDTWEQIARPTYMLEEWQGTGRRPVYGVALLPRLDASATIERGAAGEYDHHFVTLARLLVEHDQSDAVLRLGWEFNLAGSRWATPDEEAFTRYWRSVVTAMRSVPGQAFAFDWNPNNGDGNLYDAVEYYPGDAFVDHVGVDAYDQSGREGTYPYPEDCDASCRRDRQVRAWESQVYGGDRGLAFWHAFAVRRGKTLSVPEWGLWEREDGTGGGENTHYLERMHAFLTDERHAIAYHAYFDVDTDAGRHRLQRNFPDAARLFRSQWSP